MKIKKVFIAHSWTDVGVNIQTKAVAIKLSENTSVTFISQARIGKPEIIVNDHLKVIEWPNKRPNGFKDFFFLVRQIRKEKPDALIVHFGATNICMIASWLMRVRHRICWMHTLSSQYYLDSKNNNIARLSIIFRELAYKLATQVIVLNEHGKQDAIDNFKVQDRKIHKIFNGIVNTAIANTDNNNSKKSLRFCGRLDKSKGIDILLKAFAKLRQDHDNVMLEIAGRGSEEEYLKAAVNENVLLRDSVRLHGYFTSYPDALQFISEAYCLLVPSRMDNFPTAILEAMANGVPVIASRIGGIPDMIEDGKDGWLIENEDIDGLTAAMKSIVENESLRNVMSAHASTSFREKFSMVQHVNNVVDFLQNLD